MFCQNLVADFITNYFRADVIAQGLSCVPIIIANYFEADVVA